METLSAISAMLRTHSHVSAILPCGSGDALRYSACTSIFRPSVLVLTILVRDDLYEVVVWAVWEFS